MAAVFAVVLADVVAPVATPRAFVQMARSKMKKLLGIFADKWGLTTEK